MLLFKMPEPGGTAWMKVCQLGEDLGLPVKQMDSQARLFVSLAS